MSKQALTDLDARIESALEVAGLVDTMTIGSNTISGYFNETFVEDGAGEEGIAGKQITFDCALDDIPADLEQGDPVTVEGYGDFRYVRREPYSNRAVLVLGTIL